MVEVGHISPPEFTPTRERKYSRIAREHRGAPRGPCFVRLPPTQSGVGVAPPRADNLGAMRRVPKPKIVVLIAILAVVGCAMGVCTWWTTTTVDSIQIRNESGQGVKAGVIGSAFSCTDKVGAHSAGEFTLDRLCAFLGEAQPLVT